MNPGFDGRSWGGSKRKKQAIFKARPFYEGGAGPENRKMSDKALSEEKRSRGKGQQKPRPPRYSKKRLKTSQTISSLESKKNKTPNPHLIETSEITEKRITKTTRLVERAEGKSAPASKNPAREEVNSHAAFKGDEIREKKKRKKSKGIVDSETHKKSKNLPCKGSAEEARKKE